MMMLSAVRQACLHFAGAGVCVRAQTLHCVYNMSFLIQAKHKEVLLVRAGVCCLRMHIRQ